MVNLKDSAGQSSNTNFKFGANDAQLSGYSFETGEYGKQIKFEFKIGEQTFFYWHSIANKIPGKDGVPNVWLFLKNIKDPIMSLLLCQYTEDEANKLYSGFEDQFLTTIDENDPAAVEKVVGSFWKAALNAIKLPLKTRIVLHYKGQYLQMPTAKQNAREGSWHIPFGVNPVVGDNLNSVKEVPEEAPAPTETKSDLDW